MVVEQSLVDCLIESLNKEHLSKSQHRGVIKLFHKKGNDPSLIKNRRPITLTNTDYKILECKKSNRFCQRVLQR